jgi:hypothetical protein
MRWLWLQKTEPNKAWAFLPAHAPSQVKHFFSVAIISVVEDGKNTLFWKDKWLLGQSLEDSFPCLDQLQLDKGRKQYIVLLQIEAGSLI